MRHWYLLSLFLLLIAATAVAQPAVNDFDFNVYGNSVSVDLEFSQELNTSTLTSSNIKVFGSMSGAFTITNLGHEAWEGTHYVWFGLNRVPLPGETITLILTTGIQNTSNVPMAKAFIRNETVAFTSAQGGYEAPVAYATNDNPTTVLAADVDLDGHVDIAIFGTGSRYVSIRLNNGDGTFGAAVDYDLGAGLHAKGGAFGDINGDGYIDLVIATSSLSTNLVSILNDGDGTFTVGTAFAAAASFYPDFVGFADLDGDGDLDLMLSSQSVFIDPGNYVVGRMFNNGTGTFSSLNLWQVGNQPVSMTAADIDGDDDLDIAVANMNGNSVSLLINNGSANFSTIRTLTADLDSPRAIAFADLDGDGDLDMFVANHNGNNILRFLNDGNLGSTSPFAFFPTSFPTGASTFPHKLTFADADADGNTDLIAAGSDLFIFPGNGSGGFGTLRTIELDFGPHSMAVADLTGEGSADFAFIDLAGDELEIMLNAVPPNVVSVTPTNSALDVSATSDIVVVFDRDMNSATLTATTVRVEGSRSGIAAGTYGYNSGTKTLTISDLDFMPGEVVSVSVSSQASGLSGAGLNPYVSTYTVAASGNGFFELADVLNTGSINTNFVYSTDVDGDGDDDLIGFSYNTVKVYKNTGGSFAEFSSLTVAGYPQNGIVADFNNDGYPDVAYMRPYDTSFLYLLQNDGNGTFTQAATFNLGSSQVQAWEVADFDGDGNLDLAYNTGSAQLYVSYGAGDFTFGSTSYTNLDFSNQYIYPKKFVAGDFNHDGRMDLAGLSDQRDKVFVMLNNGNRSFSPSEAYAIPAGTYDIAVANLAGSTHPDLVAASDDNKSFTILTGDGDGTFSNPVTYGSLPYNLKRVTTFDFSGNGKPDLVFYAEDLYENPLLFMAYNDGNGGFGNQVSFQIPEEAPDWYYGLSSGFAVLDVNNDGALDIATPMSKDGDYIIAFIENAAPSGGGSAPTVAASAPSASNINHKSARLSWTSGDGSRRLIVMREGAPVDATLVDDGNYGPNPTFGQGTQLGSGNYFVYGGNGSSTTVIGLNEETTYHYAIYEINGIPGEEKILTAGAPTGSFTTTTAPPVFRISEGSISFSKPDYADWNLESNQDRITDNVWITRKNTRGIFNIARESEFDRDNYISPKGTLWAFGTADDIPNLTFKPWREATDRCGECVLDGPMVMYLVLEQAYVEVEFTSFTGDDNGGGFSYIRGDGAFPEIPPIDFDTEPGYALSFNGTSNFAQFSTYNYETDEYYDFADPITLEMWVKPASLPGSGEFDLVMSSRSRDLYIGINEDHKFFTSIRPDPFDYFEAIGTTTVETGKWYHVSVSVKGNGELRLYVNAVMEASATLTTGFALSTDWINLGGGYVYPSVDYGHFFHGEMDEFRIWNAERTASQIRGEMFTAPLSANPVNAALAWQMNEGSGNSVADLINGFTLDLTADGASTPPTWVASTIPFGAQTQTATGVQSGSANVGGATLTFNTPFENPVDVFFNEITTEPNVFPTGFTASLGGKYFVIDLVGDPGTFSLDLSLTFGSGVITAENEASPGLLKLYRRNSGSGDSWTEIASASSAVASTGVVTWPNITSFSEFMAVEAEPDPILGAETLSVTVFHGTAYVFDAEQFQFGSTYEESTFTVTADVELNGTLFVDVNDNGVYDDGTDVLIDTDGGEFTPSEHALTYVSAFAGMESVNLTFEAEDESTDEIAITFVSVQSTVNLSGVANEGGWYLLTNPLNTPLSTLFSTVWTQGAPGSNAPSGDATLYTFNVATSQYQAITSNLAETTTGAGTGILAYLFAFDDVHAGIPEGGGWPKTLTNEGQPFSVSQSLPFKNVDHDGLTGTSGTEGFNLMGNPYGWALSADSLIATLKRADPLANSYVYRWNPVHRTYQLLTSGAINAYESVFVRAITSGTDATVAFDYGDRHAIMLKEADAPMFAFTLRHAGSGLESVSHLRFDEKASAGIDPYDGYYLGTYARSFANLYTQVGDQTLVINNLPSGLDREMAYPIHLHASVTGEFELSWDPAMLPSGWEFILEDKSSGALIPMDGKTSHRFMAGRMAKSATTVFGQSPVSQGAEPAFVLHVRPPNVVSAGADELLPTEVELSQNYPNPFNPSTQIRYGVPVQSAVRLEVFDVLGRRVSVLVDQQAVQPGRHTVSFDASRLASGVYIYRLTVGTKVLTNRMVLIK